MTSSILHIGKPARAAQRGFALITGLLLLLVLTIIAVSMFHGFGTEEQIAGNTREKQRALNAAVSAEQWAEWWLDSGTAPAYAGCSAGIISANPGEVCDAALANFAQVPWSTGVTFTQFNQTITASGMSGPQFNYFSPPVFYITHTGTNPGMGGDVYQIDAYGYGTNASTVAVVESTYVISKGPPCLSCP